MTAHELARFLGTCPDLPCVINGWGSDEGTAFEVASALPFDLTFCGAHDTARTARDWLGYNLPRPCLELVHCHPTPPSREQRVHERAVRRRMERDRQRLTPEAFALRWAEIRGPTPEEPLE